MPLMLSGAALKRARVALRHPGGWRVRALGLALVALTAGAAEAEFKPGLPYPVEVAVAKEPQGYIFRRFPGKQRLYFSDADKVDQSTCYVGCDTAHVPVYAPADAVPIGEWTLVHRQDGRLQWAYRGRPLYTFYHDAPDDPQGEGDGWHLLPYEM